MESTSRKLTVYRSGNATKTLNYKLNLPKSWLDKMGFDSADERMVDLSFDGKKIIITKK